MTNRYTDLVSALRAAVLGPAGRTAPELRRAVEARAAVLGGRAAPPPPLPEDLAPFVDRIACEAYRVTDDDVASLKRAGYSEDALFELIACAAVGAGVGRLERGLAALRGQV